jgi:hypothetical protein
MAGFTAGTTYSINESIKRLKKAFGTGGEFGQLMEELAKTVSGSVSNLQDAFFIFQASVAKGFFDELKKQLGDLQKLVTTNQKQITQFGILVGEKIAKAMQGLRKATILVVENFDALLAVLLAIIGAKFIVFVTNLIGALKLLTVTVTGLTAVMMRNPLFLFSMGVATIITGIAAATRGLNKDIKDLDKTMQDADGLNEFLIGIGETYSKKKPITAPTQPKIITPKIPETNLPEKAKETLTVIQKIQEALNEVVSKQMTEWEKKMNNIYTIAIEGVFKGIAGISKALAESIILGKNLGAALKNLVAQALVQALAAVIKMVLEKAFLVLLEKLFGIEIKKAVDMEEKKLGVMKKQTAELAKQAGFRILLALLGAAEGGQVRGQRAEGGSVLRRAAGGRTTQTNAYLVGERGRELFVPNTDGEIISNERLQNLGTNVNFTINATDVKGVKELLIDNRAVIVNIINSALNQKGKAALV